VGPVNQAAACGESLLSMNFARQAVGTTPGDGKI